MNIVLNMKKIFICVVSLAMMAVSCNFYEEDLPAEYGKISVVLGEQEVEVVTKAAQTILPTDPTASEYTIKVYDSNDQLKQSQAYNEFVCVDLAFGSYYVTAENCTEAQAEEGNGKMRVYGESDDVEISLTNLNPEATVSCSVANAKVTVAFDDQLYTSGSCLFSDLKVEFTREAVENVINARTLTVNESDVTATPREVETWFNTSPDQTVDVKYVISGTYKDRSVSTDGTLSLAAKDHKKLLIKVSMDNGELVVPGVEQITFEGPSDTEVNDNSNNFNPYE